MIRLIEGLEIRDLKKNIDERGFFTELSRDDWSEGRDDKIIQYNLSYSYPGVIRAWHRHKRGQSDFFTCVEGAVKVSAYDDREDSPTRGEIDEFILSRERLTRLRVPGILWHGYSVIGNTPAMVLYGVNRLYDYGEPDEERRRWDDPSVIPNRINGNDNDPRVGRPWNWEYRSHK